MEKISKSYDKVFRHSFVRYVFIGGSTFAIDFLLLVVLHDVVNLNLLVSASVSYWTSIAFNFLMNRYWTFGAQDSSKIAKHVIFYLALLGFNYLFTIGFIALSTHFGVHYTVAKILAVGVQITWTYYAYKKVIFV